MVDQLATTGFPFLSLPPELRNAVYALVIPTAARLSLPHPTDEVDEYRGPWALAQVSRLVRGESSAVFYSQVQLIIDLRGKTAWIAGETYCNWITTVDESLIALVKHLVIDAEIEVERVVEWKAHHRKPWKGWFDLWREFERVRFAVDYTRAAESFEVSREFVKKKIEVTSSPKPINLGDRKWKFVERTMGALADGEDFAVTRAIVNVVAALAKVLERSRVRDIPGLRTKDVRRLMAMVWRCRAFGPKDEIIQPEGGLVSQESRNNRELVLRFTPEKVISVKDSS